MNDGDKGSTACDRGRATCYAALAALLALATGCVRAGSAVETLEPPASSQVVGTAGDGRWKEIDGLIGEQKLQEALAAVAVVREQARAAGAEPEWTRALIRETQLRSALHGFEGAVRFLMAEPWPGGRLHRVVLRLYHGRALMDYLQSYSWEIRQREKVASGGAKDLATWTADEIFQAAQGEFLAAWGEREALGSEPVTALSEFIDANTYPAGIRGTIRDALTYLYVELLADSSWWRPDHAAEVYRLDLARLLGPATTVTARGELADSEVHPLVKLVSLLGDLESWHSAGGRGEAGLEARLERYRRLYAAFSEGEDRLAIRKALEAALPAYRTLEWWSMGQSLLAELIAAEEPADALIRARAAALAGWRQNPDSFGGRKCRHFVDVAEAPEFELAGMASDGPARPSLQVSHKNLGELFFRAYRFDLAARIAEADDYGLLPAGQEVERLLAGAAPEASWRVGLPATPDLRMHRSFVTPPLDRPGAYVLIGSMRADFARTGNRLAAVNFIQSDLVIVVRGGVGGGVVATVLSGASGHPARGVDVGLYRYDWHRGHRRVAARTSDAQGAAQFSAGETSDDSAYFLFATRGGQIAFAEDRLWLGRATKGEERTEALVFTDRSVYRPLQKIRFKVVVFGGDRSEGRLRVKPDEAVTVSLADANGEAVASTLVSTNAFGSCSGEFAVPAGRLLGRWAVRTSVGGFAPVQVEEYKRPTFEVSIKEPATPLRLNRPASLRGDARYYFGLPVSEGTVRFLVSREPVWAHGWWKWPPQNRRSRVVASGEASLAPDGTFEVGFVPAADERDSGKKGISYRFRVDAEVSDLGGETRTATRVFRLGFVAVEAEIRLDAGFLREGVASELRISRTDLDGTPRAGTGRWRLVRLGESDRALLPAEQPIVSDEGEEAERFATPGDRSRPRWDHDYSQEAVLRSWDDGETLTAAEVTHDSSGLASLSLPRLSAGSYRLKYETRDNFGAVFETSRELVVGGARTSVALPAGLFVERSTVRVGETARVLVVSGLPAQRLYLEIQRDGVVAALRQIDGGADGSLVELAVGERDRGGFALRLWTVRDHQLMVLEQRVFVPWDDRELKLTLSSFRDALRPGARERFRVSVADGSGRPVGAGAAEVLAYMYDRSLDVFAPHVPPSVMSLYPTRSTLGWQHSTVKGSWPVWREDDLALPLAYAELLPDRLKFISGYGIGGPGRRRFAAGMAMPDAPMLAVADRGAEKMAAKDEVVPAPGRATSVSEADRREATGTDAPAESRALRADFAETAFFLPSLVTESDGSVAIEFDVPDSVTAWNVWLHALTKDLRGGSVRRESRSVKDLMVRPYLPRFLREGDEAQLGVVINNASSRVLAGSLQVRISDPETGEDLGDAFALDRSWETGHPFEVAAGSGASLTFAVRVPRRVGVVAFTVKASTPGFADGELRPVPVLPGRLHLAQSRFVALPGGATRAMRFADLAAGTDPTLLSESLVVTVDAQLFYAALAALPYLVDYPYECTEQILNRFVSTGILTSLFSKHPEVGRMAEQLSKRDTRLETWDAADPNRKMAAEESPWLSESRGGDGEAPLVRILDPRVARAELESSLAKLRKAQTSSGGSPWWPGGPPSPYMTLYLMHGLAKATEFGVDVPREMVERGWAYLARHVREEYVQRMIADDCCWEFLTFLNYVASCYPDATWMGETLTAEERRQILDFSFRHWRQHSPYLKSMLALTLHRMGRPRDAGLVFDSVMDSARTTEDEGTFWAPEERSWLWYNDTIETHAVALRTLLELVPQDPRGEGLVHWLMLNKKLNHWHSTKATAEVLYSLAHFLKAEGAIAARERIVVDVGTRRVTFSFEPDRFTGKANRVVVPGSEVSATSATVTAENEGGSLAFVSATWHFSTDALPPEGRGDLLAVSRRFFRRDLRGGEHVLVPIGDGERIAVGDEVEVHLAIRAKHPLEYVHLRDPRAAGCEPVSATSSFKWNLGIAWYEEIRDSGTNFFFEQLPQGEYTLAYRMRVATAGRFRVGPATLQSMYAPEFVAYSAGATITAEVSR